MKKSTTKSEFLKKAWAKMGIAIAFCCSIFLFSSFTSIEDSKEGNNDISYTNYLEDTGGQCRINVDAGDNVSFCEGEVTLTAKVNGAAACCVQYDIVNTQHCRNNKRYVLWLSDGKNKVKYYRDGGLSWREYPDGTATLKGPVRNIWNHRDVLYVNVTYSGKTTTPPTNSPKNHWCNYESSQGWQYYTKVTGTIKKRNGSWSFQISERGPAFQLGRGANITEKNRRRLGASGWFNTTDRKYKIGDFNFNLGYCEEKSTDLSYLWSTGETTPTITVSEPGTYTVEVKDCKNCVATDEVKVEEISLEVDAGEDQEICEGDEITITAEASGASECCVQYDIVNTQHCNNNKRYVLWLSDGRNKVKYYRDGGLSWREYPDGTATLKGPVRNIRNNNDVLYVDVTYSGRTTDTPQGSPKNHWCHYENTQGWEYYTEVTGTIKNGNGSWSFEISERGPAFQLGEGANITEKNRRRMGASGWFDTTDRTYKIGDFNFNLGYCEVQSSEVSYLWSTGETTQSITVSPEEDTTYTVTVQGCEGCAVSDSVEVTIKDKPTVDVGEDQNICKGEEVTLVAEVDGEGECEECVAYGITDTEQCTGNGRKFVLWLYNPTTTAGRFFTNVDLVWKLEDNGTATLKGRVYNDVLDQNYVVDVVFTGGTPVPPTSGSPKDHFCYDEDATSWTYYPQFSGTITSEDGTWSTEVSINGPAFQVGNGANTNELIEGRDGASGWFNTTDGDFTFGDFNINFGDCIETEANQIEYEWSTGETTQSITVSPEVDTTYTVKITGCTGCGEDMDTINVNVSSCEGPESRSVANTKTYPTLLNANSTLNVDVLEAVDQDVVITIYDFTGNRVGVINQKSTDYNAHIAIDLNQFGNLKAGIYILKIDGKDWTDTQRIVIQN